MRIYAGIDEAGYGPMFGPFVVARTVFAVEGADRDGDPPPMWSLMQSGVCRSKGDKRKRLAVDDSKKLYTPSGGIAALERGVLAFAHLAGCDAATLDALLAGLAHDEHSRVPDLLWYGGCESSKVPSAITPGELAITRAMLRRCADGGGVKLGEMRAAVMYEDRYNRICAATRSKGRCAWTIVAQHLSAIWDRFGEHHPFVAVDRQGGRRVYHELLRLIFDRAELRLLDESDDVSRYELTESASGRSMTVSFEVESEQRHLPVALASMTAKYVRELLMMRFNAFWVGHEPAVRPTAGYFTDGRRFLEQIERAIDRLGIDRSTLIRSR